MPHIEEIDDVQPEDEVEGLDEDNQDDDEGIVATREKHWVAPMIAPIIQKITVSPNFATLRAGEFLNTKEKNWT